MRSWLAALRIARREARRAKGRSALVVALIGLPVLALTFAAVTHDSFRLTTAQKLDRELGGADASLRWEADGPVTQTANGRSTLADASEPEATEARLLALLPPQSRAVPLRFGEVELTTATGVGELQAEWADLSDPIHEGRVVLTDGRAPVADSEVAVTRRAADRLGTSIGGTVSAADGSSTWTVVGVVEYPEWFREAVVFPARPAVGAGPRATWLVDTPAPVTWDQVQALNQHGIVVRSRAVVLDPPPDDSPTGSGDDVLAIGVLVGGLALLEVVLLAGPAFAVGARRRQRDLALVAANGGTPAHQRRIVLADGVVLGVTAAGAGIAVGTLAAVASLPLLEEYLFERRSGGLRPWPAALAGIAGLAVLTGVLAALVPAVVAARQSVVMALAGRRGPVRSKKRWLVLGLGMTGLGVAVAGAGAWRVDAEVVLAGLIASQLGLVLCTPSLVGLVARAGRFLPVSLRIALRDTARNRAAAAPAISAVMAAVAGSLAIGMYTTSDEARLNAMYQPGLPIGYATVRYEVWSDDINELLSVQQREAVHAALRDTLPATDVVDVAGPTCPPGAADPTVCYAYVPVPPENECPYLDVQAELSAEQQRRARADPRCGDYRSTAYGGSTLSTVVDDGTLLPLLTDAYKDDLAAATETLRAGGVVVADPLLVVDGEATVAVWRESAEEPELVTLPAHVLSTGAVSPITQFVSPGTIAELGLESRPMAAVAATSTVPTQEQEDALTAAVQAVHSNLRPEIERGGFRTNDPTVAILAIAAGVIVLGAAAIATGLAAADRRSDLSTLGAVGASPRVRRLLSLSQSAVIAGLGAVLGTVAGLGAAAAVLVALNQRYAEAWPIQPSYPLTVPWPILAAVLVVVPAVAMLGAGLLTRSRLPVERRVA